MLTVQFLEAKYSESYPDLHQAKQKEPNFDLQRHFYEAGKFEGRHLKEDLKRHIDEAIVTSNGYVLLNGWILDPYRRETSHFNPRLKFTLETGFHAVEIPSEQVVRYKRQDVTDSFPTAGNYNFGFVAFFKIDASVPVSNTMLLNVGEELCPTALIVEFSPKIFSKSRLLSRYFEIFPHFKESASGLAACLKAYDAQCAPVLSCWKEHRNFADQHKLIHFGSAAKPKFSVITVLYGTADLLQLQCALLFSKIYALGGEIIVVSNSPEIHNQVINICQYSANLYGMRLTAILMHDNAGFSGANNIAVEYAASDTLLLVNPDIFPFKATNWDAFLHCITKIKDHQIIAPYLHYSDGSVMHSGMSILKDRVSLHEFTPSNLQYEMLLRVDHPHKGQLLSALQTTKKELVKTEAVTGGFMIFKRQLFDAVGGLSSTYLFGHFEDADFCLRARQQDAEIHVAPKLNFVHLEEKGSKSLSPLAVSGAAIFNRCHFTRNHETAYS